MDYLPTAEVHDGEGGVARSVGVSRGRNRRRSDLASVHDDEGNNDEGNKDEDEEGDGRKSGPGSVVEAWSDGTHHGAPGTDQEAAEDSLVSRRHMGKASAGMVQPSYGTGGTPRGVIREHDSASAGTAHLSIAAAADRLTNGNGNSSMEGEGGRVPRSRDLTSASTTAGRGRGYRDRGRERGGIGLLRPRTKRIKEKKGHKASRRSRRWSLIRMDTIRDLGVEFGSWVHREHRLWYEAWFFMRKNIFAFLGVFVTTPPLARGAVLFLVALLFMGTQVTM